MCKSKTSSLWINPTFCTSACVRIHFTANMYGMTELAGWIPRTLRSRLRSTKQVHVSSTQAEGVKTDGYSSRRQHHGSTSATTLIKYDDALNQSLLRCRARCFVYKEFIESRSKERLPLILSLRPAKLASHNKNSSPLLILLVPAFTALFAPPSGSTFAFWRRVSRHLHPPQEKRYSAKLQVFFAHEVASCRGTFRRF